MQQVDAHCKGQQALQVVGYYHANENLKDTELKAFARRIADRIQQRCPQAVVLLVSKKLCSCLHDNNQTSMNMLTTGRRLRRWTTQNWPPLQVGNQQRCCRWEAAPKPLQHGGSASTDPCMQHAGT